MIPGIIFPRQTLQDSNTPTGVLAAGDEIGNITIPTTGVYIVEISAHATSALGGPRGIRFHIRQELPTPAATFHDQLLGIAQAGGHAAWSGRMILRGQVPDSLGGFSEQWAFRATLSVGLLVGESLAVNMSLTPLAYVLGLVASQERLDYIALEEVHRLKHIV